MRKAEYPTWVKLSLWGLPTRNSVWVFVWLSIAAAMGCVLYALLAHAPAFFVGAAFALAALPYWRAIRWVDKFGSWESSR